MKFFKRSLLVFLVSMNHTASIAAEKSKCELTINESGISEVLTVKDTTDMDAISNGERPDASAIITTEKHPVLVTTNLSGYKLDKKNKVYVIKYYGERNTKISFLADTTCAEDVCVLKTYAADGSELQPFDFFKGYSTVDNLSPKGGLTIYKNKQEVTADIFARFIVDRKAQSMAGVSLRVSSEGAELGYLKAASSSEYAVSNQTRNIGLDLVCK